MLITAGFNDMKHVRGKKLKVGDTIRVWWSSYAGQTDNTDTIMKLEPYKGSLAKLFKDGAQLAWFAHNSNAGMTIDNAEMYEVI
jgi:hypothetical protein